MVDSYKKTEADRRRFDIGSGIPLELLDSRVLEFVFHARVRNKLLGDYLGMTFVKDKSNDKNVYWDRKSGIGTKGKTREVIFLGVDSNDKVAINKLLASSGNVTSLLNLTSIPDKDVVVNHETINAKIDRLISRVGRLIKLAVAHGYDSVPRFRKDVLEDRTVRLMATNTVGTNQIRLIALAHRSGKDDDPLPDSHPNALEIETANKLNDNDYSEPFAPQKRIMDTLYGF